MNIMSKKKVCFLSIIVGMFLWVPVYAVLGDNDEVLAAIIEGVGGLENYEKIPILHEIGAHNIAKVVPITSAMMQVDGEPADLMRGANNDFLAVRWIPTSPYIDYTVYPCCDWWRDLDYGKNRIFIGFIYKDSHGVWRPGSSSGCSELFSSGHSRAHELASLLKSASSPK